MKTIYKITTLALCMTAFLSCSDDYLNTSPTSSTGTSTIFETTDNIALAINGLYKIMTEQYQGFGQGYNGEGTIKYYIGNFGGNDFNLSGSGNTASMNQSYHTNNNSTFILYPWYYYYKIIGNTNLIIAYANDASGPQEEKDYYIAQAKVMRAYCYLMLSQLFHRRWSDGVTSEAKNGNGLVLRLEPTNDPMPLSSAETTFAQIYADLDDAIPHLEKNTIPRDETEENYQINANVAYAVYARAAITRKDYQTALKYAQAAYKGYNLMSTAQYLSGFNTPNSEWIWSTYSTETETLYYYGFFPYMAYNASSSTIRSYPRCISKELFEKIPASDIRKQLFLDPEGESYSQTNGQVDKGTALYKKAFDLHPDINSSAKIAAFMHFKFKALDGLAIGHLNHFRSSEMYLIEAEAQYFLGNEEGAKKALNTLIRDTGRDPQYECTVSGNELLEQIKLYRRIELWGEGFEFFDIKRFGDKIDRKGFKDGGNWGATYAVKVEPTDFNYLTNVLPLKETDYNPEV